MDTTAVLDHPAPACRTEPQTIADAPGTGPATPPAFDSGRIARLFRHTVRTGGVNPLLHLMPRFRQEDTP